MIFKRVIKDLTQWHWWFAWYPVLLEDSRVLWFQRVQRRVEYGYADWYWYYKV